METDICVRETKTVSKLKVWSEFVLNEKNILFQKIWEHTEGA